MEKAVEAQLKAAFRPEFLNRVDETIVFRSLSLEDLRGVVAIQLKRVEAFLGERDIRLTMTDAAVEKLAGEGYEPAFGARPLKRAIQRLVLDELAEKVLSGEVKAGDTVEGDYEPDQPDRLAFRVQAKAE
jgi:ATP-dependent Clp protease ATP-binding subunit ClpA